MADATERGSQPFLSRVVDLFLRGQLPPLLLALATAAGIFALVATPREEEPQIVVPMADVHVLAPGLAVEEVERQVATRLEKLLTQIDGVEHVYSMSLPGRAVVTVRFFVGEDREDSLVEIHNKLHSNVDRIPPAVRSWVVKPVEIDDVPILIASLWSERPEQVDDHGLRRIAEELEIELQAVAETNRTEVVGGRPRAVRVELDPDALAGRQTSALEVAWALSVSNVRAPAGGVAVGRTSHRLRNPANAPEPWMVPLLDELRAAAPRPGSWHAVDLGARGTGYVEPIYLQPLCATCHGEAVEGALLERIRTLYPTDEAVGFHVGELRGLFWAIVPREAAP